MVRRPALAAAWGLILSACALDMGGLGLPLPADGADAGASTLEAAAGDQTAGNPEGPEGSAAEEADLPEAQGPGTDAATSAAEAASPVDAAGAESAPQEAGPSCDQDGDGSLAASCGGNDCCDQDAHVHPGQTAYFTQPGACGGFDYDCNGQETPQAGAANCQWSSFSCNGDGFAAPIPACGAFGTYTSCSIPWYDVFACNGSNAQQAQGCR